MSQSYKVSKEVGSITASSASVQVLSGTGALGALNLSAEVIDVRTTGASTATLADGKQGQTKVIVMTADLGDLVLTPTNLYAANTTITFDDVNDAVTLVFLGTVWHVVSATATVA